MLEITFSKAGIHLPRLGLWLDARKRVRNGERVFISHAHADHIAAHDEVLLTRPTSLFMRTRLPGKRREHLLEPGGIREFEFGGETFRLHTLSAGHILGSAMAHIEWRGQTLLYTGDFKLRESLAAEPAAPEPADVLIMETTFGLPHYRFPPEETVRGEINAFCAKAIDEGATPILYGYSLGKSQEVLRGLSGQPLPILLHRDVRKMTKLYEKLGMNFPLHEPLEIQEAKDRVVIAPPNSLKPLQLATLGKVRTAAVTGWALDSSCRYRAGVDAAFALSDHADCSGLLELVKLVRPTRVYTVHGFAREFAQTLRAEGVDAVAPGWHEQLNLF